MSRFVSQQFVLFLMTGAFAALINFLSRIVFSRFVSFSVAIVLAYLVGMTTAFTLNKLFVFKESRQSLQRSALFFVLVNGVAILQTWLISMALLHVVLPRLGVTHFAPAIAHAVGVMVPVFTSYVGHKAWSFR